MGNTGSQLDALDAVSENMAISNKIDRYKLIALLSESSSAENCEIVLLES